ncbi:MAG TPA: exonuclease subunit SbcD [Tepidisphaeraceae bacterium]|jgi:exonuclease SbcD|nr:exonuclease subunit SbcD [Tepidisphaeraceae bacterium]
MRIIHTSDWHLGRRLGRIDRTDDLRRAVKQVADICQREKADVLLICGDLFEQGRADVMRDWMDQLNETFGSFLQAGGTILALTGNHDNENVAQMLHQAMKLAAPAISEKGGLLMPGRFHLFTGPTFFRLADRAGGNVQFIAMPSPTPARYLKGDDAQAYQGFDERNRALKTAYAATLEAIFAHPKFDKTCPAVLAAHIISSGAEVREQVRLGEGEAVIMPDNDLPAHLAYVALGDIHKPQTLMGLEHVRYSGSIDRMDAGEVGDEKGVVRVDIDPQTRAVAAKWMSIEATPVYRIEIHDPAAEIPSLAQTYPDHERALVTVELRYRAGRDDLNALLAELNRIFPRMYNCTPIDISGGENAASAYDGIASQTLRQTTLDYVRSQLEGDEDREDIIGLVEAFVTQLEQK